MKKILSVLLAVSLLLGMCAFGEATKTADGLKQIYVNRESNLIAAYNGNGFVILDANGNPVNSTVFDGVNDKSSFFQVSIENGTINRYGAVDKNGVLVIPCEYTLFDFLSDK